MLELYSELIFRYRNSWKVIDDNELKGIILFNEPKHTVKRLFIKLDQTFKRCLEHLITNQMF